MNFRQLSLLNCEDPPRERGPDRRGKGADENLDGNEASYVQRREAQMAIEDEEEGEEGRLRSAHQEEEDVGAEQRPADVHHVA